jgi:uncharacterized protein (UPF0332 family)
MEPPIFLLKAREAIKVAQLSLDHGCLNSAANRAYFATFHAARAALVAAGLSPTDRPWSHKAIQSAFAQLIHRKKVYSAHLKGVLAELRSARDLADYRPEGVSSRAARNAVQKAEGYRLRRHHREGAHQVTKRQRQARVREVQGELLAMMQARFPRIEFLRTEELPTGTVILHVYSPYPDELMEVLETTSERIVDLGDEGLDVMVLPRSERFPQAA